MKSGSFSLAISTPLTRPQIAPTKRPAKMPSAMLWLMRSEATMLDNPTIEPTERSMPRVMITSVMPTAMTALIEDCSMMSIRLDGW